MSTDNTVLALALAYAKQAEWRDANRAQWNSRMAEQVPDPLALNP